VSAQFEELVLVYFWCSECPYVFIFLVLNFVKIVSIFHLIDSTEPDAQLNPKKKVFEQVQVDLSTGDTLVAQYKGNKLRTDLGEITVKTLASCNIK